MADSIGSGFPSTQLQIGHIFCDQDQTSFWKYIGGNPKLVTSWVLINGTFNEQPDTSLWGLRQAGAQWFYVPEGMYYGWDGVRRVEIGFYGGESMYNYKTEMTLFDDFMSGSTGSGGIGRLGWTFTSFTISSIGSEVNHPGLFRLTTSAANVGRILLGGSFLYFVDVPLTHMFVTRLNNDDANLTIRIGLITATGDNPPAQGLYFEKIGAETTWFAVSRLANVEQRTNTGILIVADFVRSEIIRTATAIEFYLDGILVATHDLTTAAIQCTSCIQMINGGGADKTLDFDYYQMTLSVER